MKLTHFRVLALITVPLRFISRSLRLKETRHDVRQDDEAITCVCSCVSEWEMFLSPPVVHVPEQLQVELVDGVVDLLPVALHQLCVVHELLLQRNTQTGSEPLQR